MAAATLTHSKDLLELIRKSGLISAATITTLSALPDDPLLAATTLVQQGLLTKFQARMLLSGKSRGFRLGHYIIRDQIGSGGMGAVYLAEHADIKRRVAIKVLNFNAAGNQLALERFLREAKTAASLDHPNIVKLYDVSKEGETRYIVMEYIDGPTLDQMIKSGPLPTARAVNYIIQTAHGLQHAYERGIIHRDIKPANLIVAKDDTLRILDMGLARPIESSGALTEHLDRGAVVGTADYVAPEQALNEPNVDIRADIYSLGVTFFALVTGRPPFDGTTANKLLSHQMKSAPSLTSLDRTFSPKLALIIAKMMEKKASNRFQTPADVIQALEPYLSSTGGPNSSINLAARGSTKSLQRTGSTRNFRPTASTSPTKVWLIPLLAGLALACIGGVVAAVLLLNGKKPEPTNPQQPNTSVKVPAVQESFTPAQPSASVSTTDRELYSIDFAKILPFKAVIDTNGLKSKTGDGDWPTCWLAVVWQKGHEYQTSAEVDATGTMTLGTKSTKGNAIVLSPEFPTEGLTQVRVRIEYRSTCNPGSNTMRLRKRLDDLDQLPKVLNIPMADEWTTVEKLLDIGEAKTVRVEFHNSDDGPKASFRLRKFVVSAVEPAK